MNQIKSKTRVSGYGEVYTNDKEVKAMIKMIDEKITKNIKSTFLEPSCGNGNFLNEILVNKLEKCEFISYNKSNFERNCLIAISSIYGIDILKDNVDECRTRLYVQIERAIKKKYNSEINLKIKKLVKIILKKNIICGNALSYKSCDGNEIVISKWDILNNNRVLRYDYNYSDLVLNSSNATYLSSYTYKCLCEDKNNERAS